MAPPAPQYPLGLHSEVCPPHGPIREPAFVAASEMSKTHLVALTESLALDASNISIEYKLAMADSIIYATANRYGAQLVTSDADFKDLPKVFYIPFAG